MKTVLMLIGFVIASIHFAQAEQPPKRRGNAGSVGNFTCLRDCDSVAFHLLSRLL